MLLKKFLFLGLAALTAASPLLDARAGTKAVTGTGTKTGTKGTKNSATCPATQPLTAGVTCPRVKFTAAQINRAVKQAKAMKVKGKTGKGLHFPAKYKPAKEAKIKGKPKAGKSVKAGKTVKREDAGMVQVLEARKSRGGSTRTRTRPTKTTKKKTGATKKKTPKKTKSTTGKKKKTTKKNKCKAGAAPAKVGKGVWMFPILEKGVWKREFTPIHPQSIPYLYNVFAKQQKY